MSCERVGAMTVIEICVDTLDGIEVARTAGADRVELCRELRCGGLTPPDDLISAALPLSPADGLQVLIRSRPGDFVYTEEEISAMCTDIERISKIFKGASIPCGFVVGALTTNGLVDEAAAVRFREAASGHRLTFHRSFDLVQDKSGALETLVHLGYQRILTTGCTQPVADPIALHALVEQSRGRILLLASGGLRSSNVSDILHLTAAPEVHMRAPRHTASTGVQGTDPEEVVRIVQAIRRSTHT